MHEVTFITFDGVKLLDVVGPAEVFAEANRFGGCYHLTYCAPTGSEVSTSTSVKLPVSGHADTRSRIDTLMVPGGDNLVSKPIPRKLIDLVVSLRPRSRRLVSICTGAFVLAEAGILSGRHATTHWRYAHLLAAAHPDITVNHDALFVEDDDVFTSAGVTAGIDLALALVERDHGADLARNVARNLVMFMQRPGGQSQFSAPLELKRPDSSLLRPLIDVIAARPALDHSATSLASRIGVSTRHLSRLFAAELDTTPSKYVESVRLDHAKSLLDSGHMVTTSAHQSGFGDPETMRRVFVTRLGISPSQYRARFGTTMHMPQSGKQSNDQPPEET